MMFFLIFLLTVSQPATTAGSSLTGYVTDDSSDVTDENGSRVFNSDTLESMPVSNIIELVERQPGILDSGLRCGSIKFFSGGTQNAYCIELSTLNAGIESPLHMRGGRSGEVQPRP